MDIEVVRARDLLNGDLEGVLKVYESHRLGGQYATPWEQIAEARNIVLNQFYTDWFNWLTQDSQSSPPTLAVMKIQALAVGYGISPAPARTDTGLAAEWITPACTVNVQMNSGTPYTSCTVASLNATLPVGTVIQFAGAQTATLTTQANPGGTTLAFTAGLNGTGANASQNYTVGTLVNVTSWTPQRMGTTLATVTATDPPNTTASFYLGAAANVVALQITEVGLMYNAPSLVAGGAGKFMTHLAFSYNKAVNTDTRFDYTLQRTAT